MTDIVERLADWGKRSFADFDHRTEADGLLTLLREARAEIMRLRSQFGKADVGASFSELTDELRHQTPGDI